MLMFSKANLLHRVFENNFNDVDMILLGYKPLEVKQEDMYKISYETQKVINDFKRKAFIHFKNFVYEPINSHCELYYRVPSNKSKTIINSYKKIHKNNTMILGVIKETHQIFENGLDESLISIILKETDFPKHLHVKSINNSKDQKQVLYGNFLIYDEFMSYDISCKNNLENYNLSLYQRRGYPPYFNKISFGNNHIVFDKNENPLFASFNYKASNDNKTYLVKTSVNYDGKGNITPIEYGQTDHFNSRAVNLIGQICKLQKSITNRFVKNKNR